jgi:hypothetical protein
MVASLRGTLRFVSSISHTASSASSSPVTSPPSGPRPAESDRGGSGGWGGPHWDASWQPPKRRLGWDVANADDVSMKRRGRPTTSIARDRAPGWTWLRPPCPPRGGSMGEERPIQQEQPAAGPNLPALQAELDQLYGELTGLWGLDADEALLRLAKHVRLGQWRQRSVVPVTLHLHVGFPVP